MKFLNQAKQFLSDVFEELKDNPEILLEVADETIEEIEEKSQELSEIVENAKPVIFALLDLFDLVNGVKNRSVKSQELNEIIDRLAAKAEELNG